MTPAKRESLRPDLMIGACLLHAILITALWVLVFGFDVEVVPGKFWGGMALIWLLWVAVGTLSPSTYRRKWMITFIASIVILAPTLPTLYAFVVWTIEGFSP